MRIGYAEDVTGNATERLEILTETIDGLYVCRHLTLAIGLDGNPYFVPGSLQLRTKEDVKEVHEEVK